MKTKLTIVLLMLCVCYHSLASTTIAFNTDFIIYKNINSFNYTNNHSFPVLIRVFQNSEIKLILKINGKMSIVNTPGHLAIPEFLVVNTGEKILFSVESEHKSSTPIIVSFNETKLKNDEYIFWMDLFNNVVDFSEGEYEKSAYVFLQLAQNFSKKDNDLWFITNFMAAISFYDGEKYDKALETIETVFHSNNHDLLYLKAEALKYKARAVSIKGNKFQAIELFKDSLKILTQINDQKGIASNLNNIGLSYHLLGKLNTAKKYYDKALNKYKSLNENLSVANLYINIGGIFFMKGLNTKAIDYYNKAITLSKELNDVKIHADALEMFAWLHQAQGDYAGLLSKWNEILEIRLTLKDDAGITRAYRLIGNSYLMYGNYNKALQFLTKSLKRTENKAKTENYPVTCNNIAQAYYHLNKIKLSKENYQKALDYNLSVDNKFQAASNYMGLARAYLKQVEQIQNKKPPINSEHLKEAMKLINKSIITYNKSESVLNLIDANIVKANIYFLQKNYNEALKLIKKLKISSKNNEIYSLTKVELLNGKILLALKKPDGAINKFRTAITLSNQQRQLIINPKHRASFAEDLETARNYLVKTLLSQSRIKSEESLITEALIVSEQGKAKSLNDLVNTKNSTSKNNHNETERLQNQLQTLYYLKTDLQNKPHFKSVELSMIKDEIQEILFKLDASYESYVKISDNNLINKNRISQLQQQMDTSTLFLAYRLMEDRSFVWHITKNRIVVNQIPDRNTIEKKIETLYNYFKSSQYGIKRHPIDIINSNNWLIDKIFPDMDLKTINKLVISPHGLMQLLPTSTLSISGEKLSKYIDIAFTPSFMIEKPNTKVDQNYSKILVIADPKFKNSPISIKNRNKSAIRGNHFKELKFTVDEAKYITNLYGKKNVDVLLAEDSTKENVLSKIQKSYELLHFATHGLIDSDIPEMSGLVLSTNNKNDNNILTIEEIMNLHIHSKTVVLSACETAIGENIREEGLIGLSYAFLAAGASHVYATLWKVGDRSALKSIEKMYSINKSNEISLDITDPFWVKFEIL